MTDSFHERNEFEDLIPGNTYHVFNKAIGTDKLFITNSDYIYFLKKIERFLLPVAEIISYCLIPNHFHLLVDIREYNDLPTLYKNKNILNQHLLINQVFSNFFNSYAKSFNKAHNRSGRLFMHTFKRIIVEDNDYMTVLINYIHRNPVHHGLTEAYSHWKYSSFNAIISDKQSKVSKEKALSLFDSKEDFITFHKENKVAIGVKDIFFE